LVLDQKFGRDGRKHSDKRDPLVRTLNSALMRWLFVTIVLITIGTANGQAALTDRKFVPAAAPAVAGRFAPLGELPATNRVSLAIGLPLHNEAALADLFQQIYDSHSTNYHKYLAPQEFTARFGPTEQDYQSVIQFAESNGLMVVRQYPNRIVLDVQGSVTDVERTFQTTLRTYRHPTEPRNFFAPDVAPSVPANLPVKDMWGWSDYGRPQPMARPLAAAKISPLGRNGSGPHGAYAGSDFRHSYVPGSSLAGSGQSVAVVEFDGYFASDISAYESQIDATNVPLQNVLLDEVSGVPGYSGIEDAVLEVSLDIELVVSMAPALSEVIVYEGSSPYDVFARIASDNQARQISCSWFFGYGPDMDWTGSGGTLDSQLLEMAVQGQSFFQAAGDSDAYTGAQALNPATGPIPVDSIYVTSVGGTSLTMTGTGATWSSETVWNSGGNMGSGGGISTNYPIPFWQTNVSMAANGGSARYRNIPDVAMTAADVFVDFGFGGSTNVTGTSCAAPLWAGFCALANQQAATFGRGTNGVGFLNPALYAIAAGAGYSACFHDIVTGNNIGNNTPGQFYATNGYDLCTGLGTPGGTNLINSLAPPAQAYFIGQPASVSVTNGGSFALTVAAVGQSPLSYRWLFDGASLNTANASVSLTGQLTVTNCTAADAGYYSVAVANDNSAITSSVVTVTLLGPPEISAGPASQIVWAGSNAVFSVTASGSDGLAYQWLSNGTNLSDGGDISGAATGQLTLLAVSTNDSGSFEVVVTNLYGSATSYVATLTVVQPPVITSPLTNETVECSGNAFFSVTAIGVPAPTCQWSEDSVAIAGATNASLTLTNVHLPAHTVCVALANLYGEATNRVTLAVQDTLPPVITLNGANPIYLQPGSTFIDPGATAIDACAGIVPVTVVGSVDIDAVGTNEILYEATDDSGNSSVVGRWVIVRDATPPAILWSFTNLVLAAGANCAAAMPDVTGTNFILATDLSGPPVISQNPSANALLVLGTNAVILTATDISGNVAYSTNTIVVADETPPEILDEPAGTTNSAGATVNFTVAAAACTPLTYQWYFNAAILPGETNATLTLDEVGATNEGNYFVVASAAGGSTASSVALLALTGDVPLVLSVAGNPDGSFVLTATGPAGGTCILQMNTNVVDCWQALFTNDFSAGTAQFVDTSATNDPQRFYRALLAP
jgi:hypothetical protein